MNAVLPASALLAVAGVLHATPSRAQAPPPDTLTLHVTQATMPGLDVAPDGAIVFDVLGQLWRVPAGGGAATTLTDAIADTADDRDPALSPEGTRVVFRGERAGRTGLWLLDLAAAPAGAAALARPLQLVQVPDAFAAVVDPAWSPDGARVAFAQTRAPDENGDRYEGIAVVDVATGVVRLVAVDGIKTAALRTPAWTGDGARIAFVALTRPAPGGWPAGRVWTVAAGGGAPTPVTGEDDAAMAPAFAPDGRGLAFLAADSAGRLQVWVQPLDAPYGRAAGRATRLTDEEDVAPTRVRWMADGASLVYAADGALRTVPAGGGATVDVPFTATLAVARARASLPPARFPEPGVQTAAKGFTGLALSPDGGTIALIALGRLWVVPVDDAGGGAPAAGGRPPARRARAIADVPITARYLAWSPDGAELAWSAGQAGEQDVYATDVATGAARRVTALPGNEAFPAYSPDGRWLAFVHAHDDVRLRVVDARSDVVADTASTRNVGSVGMDWIGSDVGAPQWSPRSDALLRDGEWLVGEPTHGALLRLDDAPAGAHLPPSAGGAPTSPAGAPPVVSVSVAEPVVVTLPDAPVHFRWTDGALVWTRHDRLWTAPYDGGAAVGAPRALGDAAAMYPSVSQRGDVLFVSGDGLRLRTAAGAERTIGHPVRYTPPVPPPLVIRGARIVDGTGAPPSAPMDVTIARGRIVAIAPAAGAADASRARAASDAPVVLDAAGGFLVPGFIDLHAHVYLPERLPAHLYFGVTLVRDQGSPIAPLAAWADAIAAGVVPGPRVSYGAFQYYTDWPFDEESGRGVEPEADPAHAARAVALAHAFGAHHVKLRTFRRWDIAARIVREAHRLGLRTTGHCAEQPPLVAAGLDAKEHIGSCAQRGQPRVLGDMRVHDDVVALMRASGTAVVPTIVYFALAARLAGDPGLLAGDTALAPFMPPAAALGWMTGLDSLGRSAFARAAAEARATTARLARAGVALGTGSDVWQLPIGVHMEMEELVAAGLTPLEVLRAATADAAAIAGVDADLGTVAVGRLADLVLLDADPTLDIRNTRRIRAVVHGGRVVDRAAIRARFAADLP